MKVLKKAKRKEKQANGQNINLINSHLLEK